MLGAFLKPNWQHKLPEKRLAAIGKMPIEDDANQSIFYDIAVNDTVANVRLASIDKMTNISHLFAVYETHSDKPTQDAAKQRLCKVIGPGSKVSETDLEELLKTHPTANFIIAEYSENKEIRHRLIKTLDQTKMASLLGDVAFPESRRLIAEHLTELLPLETARKNLKGKDKTSEKIVRQKIEKIRATVKQENANRSIATGICEQLEFIANHPEWRAEFKGKYELYQQRWAALDFEIDTELSTRFKEATSKANKEVIA